MKIKKNRVVNKIHTDTHTPNTHQVAVWFRVVCQVVALRNSRTFHLFVLSSPGFAFVQ